MSITSPTIDQAEKRPGPVATTRGRLGNSARTASAQRAARAAWSLGLPASGRTMTTDPSGRGCMRAPWMRWRSSSRSSTRPSEGVGADGVRRPWARTPRGGVEPYQRCSDVGDGPAMTTQAMRCSVAVRAG